MQNLKRLHNQMLPFVRGVRASAAMEFAVGVPLLAALLVPLIDMGMGFYQTMQVQDAAQAGAQYALAHGWNSAAIQNAVLGATTLSSISAAPPPTQSCGCPAGMSITPAPCGSTCTDGQPVSIYVTASAQSVYTPLVPYPALGSVVTLSAQATARIP
jgi:Flp pilus assembly protein TadG